MLNLDKHDENLVAAIKETIESAILNAHAPVAVIKRISVFIVRHRNQGRKAAMKRNPFNGICEVSGLPLERKHAHLDECEPELGYSGKVMWTCPRANNSGTHSCGKC